MDSLFNKVAGLRICNFRKKRLQHRHFSPEIWETVTKKYLQISASVSSQVILFAMHEKYTANEQ